MNKNHQNGFNSDIQTQLILLEEIIKSNNMLCEIIDRAAILELENYYIGAGCITQTVWNYLSGNDPCYGIKDIDFVYFDDVNLDFASENKIISRIKQLYKSYVIQIDVKNQARVHLWYKWYERNLKIFSNIQNLCKNSNRLFIIYGAGHLQILRDLINASENLTLVDVYQYL